MDCFYAAVEMRDLPKLRNIPLAVGGTGPRSVLTTCNYLARKFGVRSAMSSVYAKKLCPSLEIVPVNMEKYRYESKNILKILSDYTDKIQPLGLDEAYLDVSDSKLFKGSATLLAKEIKKRIYHNTKLTASAGVAPNKFLAKIASDWNKPDGLFVIHPDDVDLFLKGLKVEKINGVGKVTAQKLKNLGLYTCEDIKKYGQEKLMINLGKYGQRLYELSCGKDDSEVHARTERKSLSTERTFNQDLITITEMKQMIKTLFPIFQKRLLKYITSKDYPHQTKGLFVKLKFNDFRCVTSQSSFNSKIDPTSLRYQELKEELEKLLLMAYERGKRPIRLLGIGVFFGSENTQLKLL